MVIHHYQDFIKSLSLDIKRGKEVSFLFGSALSYSPDGKGVPNVSGMSEILTGFMQGIDIYDSFIEENPTASINPTENYQKGFEYLLKVGDPEDVKEVMRLAMQNIRDEENGTWFVTKALTDLAQLISETDIKVKYILTTNFDPLIEASLKKVGCRSNTFNLIIDQPITSVQSYSDDVIPIVHLHGVWDGDTMHTTTQLKTLRGKIETSIKSILSMSKLYVIGYAGWDDVFLTALKGIVNENQPSYNIRWAFFNNSASDIENDNAKLIDIVTPALLSGRFQAYSGIDCNVFFSDMLDELAKKKVINKSEISLSRSGIPTRKKDKSTLLTTYNLSYEPSHDVIRILEQKKAITYLNTFGCFELISGWGYGKAGFIYSFLHKEFSEYSYFYTDLNGLNEIVEIEKKIRIDIGVDITSFLSWEQIGKRIIIIDNIGLLPNASVNYLVQLAEIVVDTKYNVKIIFVANESNNISSQKIYLSPLAVTEIHEYMCVESDISNIKREDLDRLYQITNGIPLKLDKVKEYNRLMNLQDILNAGDVVLPEENMNSDIPHSLSKTIRDIKSDDKKLYSLLLIFSILDCGERLANIRKHYSSFNFDFEDFSKLERNGLIYRIVKDNDKILRIGAVVKDFVKKSMNNSEHLDLIKTSLDICIGDKWMSGEIHVRPVPKMMLKHPEFYPGNVHSVIDSYFKLIILNLDERETKAIIHASVGYCDFLHDNCLYKELVSFSRMVFSKIEHLDCNDKYRIAYFLATGLRMIDEDEQSVAFLEPLKNEYSTKGFCQKSQLYKMWDAIILGYSTFNAEKSYHHSLEVKKVTPKTSNYYMLAECELANKLDEDKKIKKLIQIEKKARTHGYRTLANNISLRLHKLLPSTSFKYIDKVIDNDDGIYNRNRALILKYEELISRGELDKIGRESMYELRNAYDYLFTQRLDALFNKCTHVLWEMMKHYGDVLGLYSIFKQGSIIWRVTSLYDREFKYAKDLISQSPDKNSYIEDADYLLIRMEFLVVRFDDPNV